MRTIANNIDMKHFSPSLSFLHVHEILKKEKKVGSHTHTQVRSAHMCILQYKHNWKMFVET